MIKMTIKLYDVGKATEEALQKKCSSMTHQNKSEMRFLYNPEIVTKKNEKKKLLNNY